MEGWIYSIALYLLLLWNHIRLRANFLHMQNAAEFVTVQGSSAFRSENNVHTVLMWWKSWRLYETDHNCTVCTVCVSDFFCYYCVHRKSDNEQWNTDDELCSKVSNSSIRRTKMSRNKFCIDMYKCRYGQYGRPPSRLARSSCFGKMFFNFLFRSQYSSPF